MTHIRAWLRWARANLFVFTGAIWWAKRRLRQRRAIVVLMLHRVLDDDEFNATHSLRGIIVRKKTFEQLAAYVAQTCKPVDVTRLRPGERSSAIPVAFTFDDGWIDNYTTAFPLARTHGIPMTIFICSGLMGCDAPFWPERVTAALKAQQPEIQESEIEARIEDLKQRAPGAAETILARSNGHATPGLAAVDRTFSWEQAEELRQAGVGIGAHTHTHQILTGLKMDSALEEIQQSKSATDEAMRTTCRIFAYPNGNHSAAVRALVANAGFDVAFTTTPGAWTLDCNGLAIPRMNVAEDGVTGPNGSFSPAMFDYWVMWRAWRAMQQTAARATSHIVN
jgi:peptidoglycan/xylan/chitin deacetylase (PgdA/CDA1 family)